jgi:hypothetical protein
MQEFFAVLFAAGFNVQQALATGVIGGGAGLLFGAIAPLVQKPKPSPEGRAVPKKFNPLTAFLMIVLGLALVFAGIAWRVASQDPARR